MVMLVRSLIAHLFGLCEPDLKKRLRAPRETLSDTERQLAHQIKTRLRRSRRIG